MICEIKTLPLDSNVIGSPIGKGKNSDVFSLKSKQLVLKCHSKVSESKKEALQLIKDELFESSIVINHIDKESASINVPREYWFVHTNDFGYQASCVQIEVKGKELVDIDIRKDMDINQLYTLSKLIDVNDSVYKKHRRNIDLIGNTNNIYKMLKQLLFGAIFYSRNIIIDNNNTINLVDAKLGKPGLLGFLRRMRLQVDKVIINMIISERKRSQKKLLIQV